MNGEKLMLYKGFLYVVQDDTDYDVVKKWHSAMDTVTKISYDIKWSPYSYVPREEFEKQVDEIVKNISGQ